MTIAQSVNNFLSQQQISFDTVQHPPSHSSVQSAIAAQVPLSNIAKAVILKDSIDNYLMAVIPASNRVQVRRVSELTDTPVKLATEQEVNSRFRDCQNGAIPPIGQAYDIDMIWDNRLGQVPDIYLEAGDHETLIHLTQQAFQQIVGDRPHNDLCSTPEHETTEDR